MLSGIYGTLPILLGPIVYIFHIPAFQCIGRVGRIAKITEHEHVKVAFYDQVQPQSEGQSNANQNAHVKQVLNESIGTEVTETKWIFHPAVLGHCSEYRFEQGQVAAVIPNVQVLRLQNPERSPEEIEMVMKLGV